MKVFYLDDDIEELELFMESLQEISPSINCLAYNDSGLALRELSNHQSLDLIFLDYNMPVLTGEDCLQLIRQMPHLRSIPIIIYSTGIDENLKKRLLRCGATMVIRKHQTSSELKRFFVTHFMESLPKH